MRIRMVLNLPAAVRPSRRRRRCRPPSSGFSAFRHAVSERKAPNPYSQEVHSSMSDQKPSTPSEDQRNSYERKQDAKRERLLKAAEKAEREGDARIKRADEGRFGDPDGTADPRRPSLGEARPQLPQPHPRQLPERLRAEEQGCGAARARRQRREREVSLPTIPMPSRSWKSNCRSSKRSSSSTRRSTRPCARPTAPAATTICGRWG